MRPTKAETSALVPALLEDSLCVWKIAGHVSRGKHPADATIYTDSGSVATVEHSATADAGIRWWVRWQPPAGAPCSVPCTSTIGLLRAVREALGAERGPRLRIAPSHPA